MGILQARVESGHITTSDEYCAIPPATVRYVFRELMRRMYEIHQSRRKGSNEHGTSEVNPSATRRNRNKKRHRCPHDAGTPPLTLPSRCGSRSLRGWARLCFADGERRVCEVQGDVDALVVEGRCGDSHRELVGWTILLNDFGPHHRWRDWGQETSAGQERGDNLQA